MIFIYSIGLYNKNKLFSDSIFSLAESFTDTLANDISEGNYRKILEAGRKMKIAGNPAFDNILFFDRNSNKILTGLKENENWQCGVFTENYIKVEGDSYITCLHSSSGLPIQYRSAKPDLAELLHDKKLIISLMFTTLFILLVTIAIIILVGKYIKSLLKFLKIAIYDDRKQEVPDEYRFLMKPINDIKDTVKQLKNELAEKAKTEIHLNIARELAHDIKSPMFGITEGIEMLNNNNIDDEMKKEIIQAMGYNASKMSKYVNSLLDFTRKEQVFMGNVAIVDLYNYIDESIKHITKSHPGINISIVKNATIKEVRLDIDKIDRVISNLIQNSIKAMSGQGTVFITITDSKSGGILFSVKDAGCGISLEDLPKVFEPHFTTDTKNHGLGLAICKKLVKLHNGKIAISSELNKGTTVSFEV